jgi:pyruvate/2-oxoglutarate/acetoin dehydrogenase E1 component
MPKIKYWKAVNEALREEMLRDEQVCLIGEDAGVAGGAFGGSRGLYKEFGPIRVKDTPISEEVIVGAGIGAAITGIRPVVEIMFMDFITLALDQLINHAAKLSHMTNGQLKVPLTILTHCAVGRNSGPQHTQSIEVLLSHIPGLKVVWASTPADAKGLIKAAIRDDNPVIVICSLNIWTKADEVPDGSDWIIPIGKADIKQEGNDVTLISVGGALPKVQLAASQLAERGMSIEIVDVRSLSPLDSETILSSVSKTKRAVVIHDAVETYGVGAEIVAQLQSDLFHQLKGPVMRVGAKFTPPVFSPELSKAHYPQVEQVVQAAEKLMKGGIL